MAVSSSTTRIVASVRLLRCCALPGERGKDDLENASRPFGAPHRDAPAVPSYHLVNEREAETEPVGAPGPAAADEPPEDPLPLDLGNPRPLVGHGEERVAFPECDGDPDPRGRRRELQRVGDEVVEDAGEEGLVPEDEDALAGLDRDATRRSRSDCRGPTRGERAQVDGAGRRVEAREAHLLHRVQRLDHPAEPLRLLAHHPDDARALGRREVETGEELRESPDGREGSLHLVDRDASRLELFGPESGAAGRLPLAEARGARFHREEHEERGAGQRGDRKLDPRRQQRRAEAERHDARAAEEEAAVPGPASSRQEGQPGHRRGEKSGGERRDGSEKTARQEARGRGRVDEDARLGRPRRGAGSDEPVAEPGRSHTQEDDAAAEGPVGAPCQEIGRADDGNARRAMTEIGNEDAAHRDGPSRIGRERRRGDGEGGEGKLRPAASSRSGGASRRRGRRRTRSLPAVRRREGTAPGGATPPSRRDPRRGPTASPPGSRQGRRPLRRARRGGDRVRGPGLRPRAPPRRSRRAGRGARATVPPLRARLRRWRRPPRP